MSESDPISNVHNAMNSGMERAMGMTRRVKDRVVTKPAVRLSTKQGEFLATGKQPKEARQREYLTTRHDPRLIAEKTAEQAARFDLPAHKPFPRNVVQYFLDGEREFGVSKDSLGGS